MVCHMTGLGEAYRTVNQRICELFNSRSGRWVVGSAIAGALVYAAVTGEDTAVIAGLAAALASVGASNRQDG